MLHENFRKFPKRSLKYFRRNQRKPIAPRRFWAELLEMRTVPSTLLAERPLIFDPTQPNPDSPNDGDEIRIGTIAFDLDGTDIIVTYAIDADKRAIYDCRRSRRRSTADRWEASSTKACRTTPNVSRKSFPSICNFR